MLTKNLFKIFTIAGLGVFLLMGNAYAYDREHDHGRRPNRHPHGYNNYPHSRDIVIVPVGTRVAYLPSGYRRIFVAGNPYYLYNGNCYRRTHNGYVSVALRF